MKRCRGQQSVAKFPICQLTGLACLGLDLFFEIISYLQKGLRQWACLRSVCKMWQHESVSVRWLGMLRPKFVDSRKLQSLSRLVGLQELDISWMGEVPPLSDLVSLTSLRKLNLSSCGFEELVTIDCLISLSRLEWLALSRNCSFLNCSLLTKSNWLSQMTSLISLKLNRCRVEGLSSLSSLTQLRELSLRHCRIEDEDLQALGSLLQLRVLDLNENGITVDGLTHLIPLCKLESLKINGCEQICNIEALRSLTLLSTLECDVSDDILLTMITSFPSLQTLVVGSWDTTDRSMKLLGSMSSLTHLECDCQEVDDWKSLSTLTNLQVLSLRNTHITDEDLCMFCSLPQLHTFILSETNIIGHGLSQLTTLTALDVSFCYNLVPETVLALLQLRALNISGRRVPAQVLQIRGLQELIARGCVISEHLLMQCKLEDLLVLDLRRCRKLRESLRQYWIDFEQPSAILPVIDGAPHSMAEFRTIIGSA